MTSLIGNSEITRKANALRRELAEQFGVRPRFVSLGSCLKAARGAKARLNDTFGSKLGSIYSKINQYLLSEDCPVVIDAEGTMAATGCTMKEFIDMMSMLEKRGVVYRPQGWYIMKLEKRPY